MTAPNTIRPKGKEHFPHYPRGFTVLRILQLGLSVLLLGLVSYTVYWAPYVGACLMLFTVLNPSPRTCLAL